MKMTPGQSRGWNAYRCRHCAHRNGWRFRLACARIRRGSYRHAGIWK